jgi:hypothetical protein
MTGAISIATKTASKNISFEQGKAPEKFRGFLMSTGDDILKLAVRSNHRFSMARGSSIKF